jgi:hypothetical protein
MQPDDDEPDEVRSDRQALTCTLEMLRKMGDGADPRRAGRAGGEQRTLSEHLAKLRLMATMRSHKVATVITITCASAGVIGVLKILSDYFE